MGGMDRDRQGQRGIDRDGRDGQGQPAHPLLGEGEGLQTLQAQIPRGSWDLSGTTGQLSPDTGLDSLKT